MDKLTPPPDVRTAQFADWLFLLRKIITGLQEATPVTVGSLSPSQKADLTDGGDSSMHFHAADRARNNHTGTQSVDTISDLESFVQSRIGTATASNATDYLGCQVFGP